MSKLDKQAGQAIQLDQYFDFIEPATDVTSLRPLPEFEACLSSTLTLVSNLLHCTSEFSLVLKNNLASRAALIQSVALPYMLFALDLLERNTASPATHRTLMVAVHTVLLSDSAFARFVLGFAASRC